MKRLIAILLAGILLCTMFPAVMAEEETFDEEQPELNDEEQPELSDEELAELEALDAVEDTDSIIVVGNVYQEPDASEFNASSPAIYTCRIIENSPIYNKRVKDPANLITNVKNNKTGDVLFVGCDWVVIRWTNVIGYIKREKIFNVKPVNPVTTEPYGVQKSSYIATTATECHIRKSMSNEDEAWLVLNPGTLLTIWKIQDGWAIFPFKRTYGYVNMNELTDLIPVSPSDAPVSDDTPIAAYTSYYNMAQTDINKGRIINISVACSRLTRVMAPGEKLDFNKQVGPFRKGNGYQQAIVLIEGRATPGSGGGTCQVSSTLYNALLQLPGITVLQRRAHGPGGASYLPHGVDAAVGNSALNLRFRNDYDFPIRVEGHSSGDGALCMVIYKVAQ